MKAGVLRVTPTSDQAKSWWERVYLLEVIRGLSITIAHFIANMGGLRAGRVGMTHQFPERPKPIASTWKGEHRLMQREDGSPRCVACNCCSTACPADCIVVVGADRGGEEVEKYPVRFDIDILQCVFCGLCVEACPCDAIRMDTGKFTEADYLGPARILDLEYLLDNHPPGKVKVSSAIF